MKMSRVLMPIIIILILVSSACAPAQTSSATVLPLVTPSPTPEVWNKISIVDESQKISSPNDADHYSGTNIYGSSVELSTDTRWNFSLQVDKLVEDVGESSTGLILSGQSSDGKSPTLFCGYQNGFWNLGYTPDMKDGYTFWKPLTSLVDSKQNFQLTLSNQNKQLQLTTDAGFTFSETFDQPLFANTPSVNIVEQLGPHTSLDVLSISVEQKPLAVAAGRNDLPAAQAIDGQNEILIHVAVSGSDDNLGSAADPLATIGEAQRRIRLINKDMQGPILVVIHDGTYALSSPIEFQMQDSGQNGFQVTYEAAEGETPILSGGVAVSGWQQQAGSHLWTTQLPANTQLFRQLYVNGKKAQRAAATNTIRGQGYAKGDFGDRDGIIVSSSSIPDLTDAHDLELHWIDDWNDMRLKVDRVEKNQDGTSTLWMVQPYYFYAMSMGSADHPWYPGYDKPFRVENALALLDQPGEWYYDSSSHILYYWPKEGEDMSSAQVILPQLQTLVKFTGNNPGNEVHDLVLKGLTFAYTNWNRASTVGTFGWQAQDLITGSEDIQTPAHLDFSSAKNITLQADKFIHMGAAAIHLGNNTSAINIRGNLFYDTADAAIVVGSWKDAYLLSTNQVQPQNITIADNLIDSAGSEYWGAAGINAYYVANVTISHNEISHLPYTGISLGWGWTSTVTSITCKNNTISNNLITDISQIARDAGGIYTLGPIPGMVVNGNVFRRIKGDYACLYPDEGSAHITYSDNVCDTAPEWLHAWTDSIHDINISGTYTNVAAKENRSTNSTIKSPVWVSGQQWPAAAQAIMQSAGLEADYSYLHDWLAKLTQ